MRENFSEGIKNWLADDDRFTTGPIVPGEGPTSYWEAAEVEQTASRLIPLYHEMLGNSDVQIVYFFRSDIPKKGGKLIFGVTKKIMGLNAALAECDEPFFCIVISHPAWEVLPQKHRDALVDHELCHCGIEVDEKGETRLVLRNHDVQEFSDIVRRHGAWSPDVQEFLRAALGTKKSSTPLLDGKSRSAGEK